MTCDKCENDPCTCRALKRRAQQDRPHGKPCIVVYCSVPQCGVRIRYEAGKELGNPLCKWHQQNNAYNMPRAKDDPYWPAGMPNPENPWPWLWQDPQEVERRLKLPYWQARFKHWPNLYEKYIRQGKPSE